ncbi:dioxygenase family protein [Ideonella dechloratans]|uniref:dioxygenase family protein n=1 Tax=Ideonella dechloratans TaxID=36863 RepID=UPI0035B4C0B1
MSPSHTSDDDSATLAQPAAEASRLSLPAAERRLALGWLSAGGLALSMPLVLAGCGGGDSASGSTSSDSGSSSSDSGSSGSSTSSSTCPSTEIASETGGPYPADGSNTSNGSTVDVLSLSGILRSDIRSNVGESTLLTGLPLTLTLTVVDLNKACAAIEGAAVYIWHCDKDGEYSAYNTSANGDHVGETYLRGVQLTDANGQVSFTTVYPGWYAGRITHIHAEVYLDGNYASGTPDKTTQFAFPQSVTTEVYASSLYVAHGQNTSVTSFSADNVFSDGTDTEMLTLSGDTSSGYAATLTLGLDV